MTRMQGQPCAPCLSPPTSNFRESCMLSLELMLQHALSSESQSQVDKLSSNAPFRREAKPKEEKGPITCGCVIEYTLRHRFPGFAKQLPWRFWATVWLHRCHNIVFTLSWYSYAEQSLRKLANIFYGRDKAWTLETHGKEHQHAIWAWKSWENSDSQLCRKWRYSCSR